MLCWLSPPGNRRPLLPPSVVTRDRESNFRNISTLVDHSGHNASVTSRPGDDALGDHSALDARISLATAVHSQPGVYALLLGSGVSTGVGVPTGWGIIQALVTRAAAANGDAYGDELDPEVWWTEHGDGQPLGYSGLLSTLAATPAARRALLAGFFEPTDEEREQGIKVPGAAHRAIATLVRRGAVRVILTTNFDRLIEQALEAEGVFPQVIASASAIDGMEPLPHARCTLIKLHGDFARIDQLNSIEELSQYGEPTRALLDRVLDEYGLVINGWSGDWDYALVAALEGRRSRRYPLYWATYGALGETAQRLVAQHRAHVIEGAAADQFFTDLVERMEALDRLTDPPLTKAMALARLKRLLPDPMKHIELRDLLDNEVSRLREYIATRPQVAPSGDPQAWQDEHDEIRQRCDTLIHLVAQGVFLDRDRQHSDLWVWVIEQLMRARTQPEGTYNVRWTTLDHYPALLALTSASLAAVSAQHDDVLLRLLREPTWRDPFKSRTDVEPAADVLQCWHILHHDVINSFPKWSGTKWLYPASHVLKEELRPVLLPLVGDEDSYIRLYNRTEYRTALAQFLFSSHHRAVPGEFVGDWQWDDGRLIWELDFRSHSDRDAWGWSQVSDGENDPINTTLTKLTEDLKKYRRWG